MQTPGSPGCGGVGGGSSGLLTVDEGARPRALSEPSCDVSNLQPALLLLPEITVEDCTDPELSDLADGGRCGGQGRGLDPSCLARPRANTCPEDLFQKPRGERPPTPPPGTYRKVRRFQSGFSKPVVKETVSFAHHRLCKLTESEDAEESPDSDSDGGGSGGGGCSGGGSDPDLAASGASAAASAAAGVERLRLSSHPANSWPSRYRCGEMMPFKCGLRPELGGGGEDQDVFLSSSDSSLLPSADKNSLAAGGGGSGGDSGGAGGGGGGSLLAVKASRRPGATEPRSPDSRFVMTGNQRSVVPATRLTIF